MTKIVSICLFGLILGAAGTAAAQQPAPAPLKIFLNEVLPGVMSAPQYCTLIFDDHRFHSEKADIKHGRESDRKVFEGQLSENDWKALLAIIDNQNFRDLKVPQFVPPPVMQDTHPYTISVAREKNFQNMEFLTNQSLKPYEPQVKPLLSWWKNLRSQKSLQASGSPDSRCALDNAHAIVAQ
jgi:hypothetical protein